jgi:hypothetical protein
VFDGLELIREVDDEDREELTTAEEVVIVNVVSEAEVEDEVSELIGEVVVAFGIRKSTPAIVAIAITRTTTTTVTSRAMADLLLLKGIRY